MGPIIGSTRRWLLYALNISMSQTPATAGRLDASTVPLVVIRQREEGVRRIWVTPIPGSGNPASYLAPGFRLAGEWNLPGNQVVLLYATSGKPGSP